MKNTAGPEAGMPVTGAFLRHFADDAERVYLDVVGPSFDMGEG